MAAYHVVWECVVVQWLGVRHMHQIPHFANIQNHRIIVFSNTLINK